MALRLLLAAVLGGAIGFQRERAGKPAGLRTHMLICIGAALFTLVSIFAFRTSGSVAADPSRVAAGVVTGIGFLGAGAIIFRSQDGYISRAYHRCYDLGSGRYRGGSRLRIIYCFGGNYRYSIDSLIYSSS